jgi:hypothetical protein
MVTTTDGILILGFVLLLWELHGIGKTIANAARVMLFNLQEIEKAIKNNR